jgi:hypothetical protein
MIYQDSITEKEFLKLSKERGFCVSIYFPTPHQNLSFQADRLSFNHMVDAVMKQAYLTGPKVEVEKIEQRLRELSNDHVFWIYQGKSLAVLANSERMITYRLSYDVANLAKASDRFYLKPLLPALHPQGALVLAISQKSVNLYEYTPTEQLVAINVPHLPADLLEATGRDLQQNGVAKARLRDETGKKVVQQQFMRAIEKAVKPIAQSLNLPLILATTKELAGLYRSVNSYYLLSSESIVGSVENISHDELVSLTKPIVSKIRGESLEKWDSEFNERRNEALTSTDLATIAKLASQGQVSKLLVDVDSVVYGRFDDSGSFQLLEEGNNKSYDLIDEIVDRVLSFGGEVMAVRNDEAVPDYLLPISASFRWA